MTIHAEVARIFDRYPAAPQKATIRALMGDRLDCVGNREIKLPLEQALPQDDLQLCLTMAMTYKKIKHLPLLGF